MRARGWALALGVAYLAGSGDGEPLVMLGRSTIAEVLGALKALGVRLVLDDFGTGYSSLSYLPQLPFDALKIDRSFLDGLGTEPHDTAITEAIVAMSRALSLSVVAEGVEQEGQVAELMRLGCLLAQGFHFSRPVPASEVTDMLRDGHDAAIVRSTVFRTGISGR